MSNDQVLPPERLYTLWVHDDTFSKQAVIFNKALLASHGQKVQSGALLKVVRASAGVAVHDFQSGGDDAIKAAHINDETGNETTYNAEQSSGIQAGSDFDAARQHLVFVVEELDSDYLTKHPGLQVLYQLEHILSSWC